MLRLMTDLRRFWSNKSGNIAILFGLAVVPIIGAMGAALDYSLANQNRTQMQAALDNTGLMLSKLMPLTQTQLNTQGWQIFQANLGTVQTNVPQANLTINAATQGQLILDVSGTYTLGLGKVLSLVGMSPTFAVSAHSEVTWGSSRLRVALVLDNTGSMSQSGKITALKTATNNLISQLQSAAVNNGDVYVSIVPFVKDVNVGPSNYTASWIDWYYWEQDSNNQSFGTCSKSGYYTKSTCTAAGTCSVGGYTSQSSCTSGGTCSISGYTTQTTCTTAGTCSLSGYTTQSTCQAAGTCSISGHSTQSGCTSAGTCSKSQYTSQSQCTGHGGTWTAGRWTAATWTAATWTAATWTPATWTFDHSQWNGCVMDRGSSTGPGTSSGPDQDLSAASATVEPNPATAPDSTKYPAEQYSLCPAQAVIPLTYNWSSLTSAVNGMSPNGTTNQPIGLVLGWLSLVGGGPFPTAPAMDPNYTYNQVIILLTDGLNTQDRWYGDGFNTSTAVDQRMYNTAGGSAAGTCANIKAAGIIIYTVQVDTDGSPTSTLLQNCATDASKFFLLTSSSQIVTTFQQIGTQLANLHLSQ
ncbi:MAG TPA: TadE/TadG family type IV pilus assembly protein [Xanthobacteraceae bacterium]|nr:TadE/TadG family type IV pilus assembly protein [Xanthobacteraceae bacterium]